MGKEQLDTSSMLILLVFGGLILLSFSSVVSYEISLFIKELNEAKFNLTNFLIALVPLLALFYYSNYKFHNSLFKKREQKKQRELELATLSKFGYETRNQECTIAVIEMLKEDLEIDIDDKFIKALKVQQGKESDQNTIELREDFQYSVKISFEQKSEFDRLDNMCKELIDVTREIVTED